MRRWSAEELERRDRLLAAAALLFGAAGTLVLAARAPRALAIACFAAGLVGAAVGLVLKWLHERAKARDGRARDWHVAPTRMRVAAAAGTFYDVGVEAEAPEALALLGRRPGEHAPYVPRTIERELRRRLHAGAQAPGVDLVVLAGPSKSGKSRTLLEAAARELGDAWLLAPRDAAAFDDLAHGSSPRELRDRSDACVVWVDDLEEVARRGAGLNVSSLRALEAWDRPVLVLATQDGKGVRSAGRGNREHVEDLRTRYPPLRLDPHLDEEELAAVGERFSPRVAERVAREGLGEFLIAAPRLLARLAQTDCAEGRAIVLASIDCRRAGIVRGLSAAQLEALHVHRLVGPPSSERFREGLRWALRPLYSNVAPLVREPGGDTYLPYDYLVEHGVDRGEPVDDATWRHVVERIADSEEDLLRISYAATDLPRAERACRRADALGSAEGASHLGELLGLRGAAAEALEAYRRGDARGSAKGANNLGVALKAGGDLDGAEAAYRRADERGSAEGAVNLGNLLRDRGKLEAAEAAYRRGAQRGSAIGANKLGVALERRGEAAAAEAAFAWADERGHPAAASNLGLQLQRRGELAAAEAAYRRADERGDGEAACNLGRLLRERGDLEGAAAAFARADERGVAAGTHNLGLLHALRGDLAGAERLLRRAERDGIVGSAVDLGNLLRDRGDLRGAEARYRLADAAGSGAGATCLGALLRERDDFAGAEAAYRRADERGSGAGAGNLGTLLVELGDLPAAVAAYRCGDARGSVEATMGLGWLLFREGDLDGAEDAFRRAEERGDADAASCVGAVLYQRDDDVEGAIRAFARADERGSANGAENLAEMLRWRNRPAEAAAAFRRADERGGARGAYEVGVMLEAGGDRAGAIEKYRVALARAFRSNATRLPVSSSIVRQAREALVRLGAGVDG